MLLMGTVGLSQGGILVFMTGQQEVEDLCRLLRREFSEESVENRKKRRGMLWGLCLARTRRPRSMYHSWSRGGCMCDTCFVDRKISFLASFLCVSWYCEKGWRKTATYAGLGSICPNLGASVVSHSIVHAFRTLTYLHV